MASKKEGAGVSRDEEVVGPDGFARALQLGSDTAIFSVRRDIERKHGHAAEDRLYLGQEPGGPFLRAAVAQLRRGDDADANRIGTDLRVDRPSWWTTQWYAEAGRFLQHPQTYGLASLQAGRSLRLDGVDQRLVVFPHLTLNTDYNSLNQQRSATGIGIRVTTAAM